LVELGRGREVVLVNETAPPNDRNADKECGRCGGDLALLTVLPRVGEHPTYRIFGCAACSFIEWIAEQIED
jgi:hypothetical protein